MEDQRQENQHLFFNVNYHFPLKTEIHSFFTLISTVDITRGASSSLHSVCPLGNKNNGRLERAFDQKQELALASSGKNCKSCLPGEKEYETEGGPPPGPGAVTGLLKQLYILSGYFSILEHLY